MNNVVKPNDVVAENPYTFGDSAMAIRVASELIDLAHDAIAQPAQANTAIYAARKWSRLTSSGSSA